MEAVAMNQSFIPTQITTGSFIETLTSYQVNKDKGSSFDYIGYLMQTHCPEKPTYQMTSSIDLIKVVFPNNTAEKRTEIKGWLTSWLRDIGISVSTQQATLRHHSNGMKLFPLDESKDCCGSLKWDLKKNKIQLELTGAGCRYVNVSQNLFFPLYAMLSQYQGIITEVDIAVDDFTGFFNLRRMQKVYDAGGYTPKRGCRPVRNPEGKHLGTEYLGRSDSAKSMCIYEKWRELGLPESHPLYGKWIRHELTYRRRNRHVISLDVLIVHDREFVGAYKYHKQLIKNVQPRCPVREKSIELVNSLSKSVAYCKFSYGRIINKVAQLVGDDELAIRIMSREGSPSKFILPSFLDETLIKTDVFNGDMNSFNEEFMALVDAHNPLLKKGKR